MKMPYKDSNINKEYMKLYRERHKEKQKKYQQEYKQQHKEKLRLYKEIWYKNKRGDKLYKTYGITLKEFYNMLELQDYCCSICNIIFSDVIKPYVDHNHKTGKVRGLLCMNCNTGLGHFKDNYKNLVKAARYVY